MKEILRHGKTLTARKTICPYCGCVFTFDGNDVFRRGEFYITKPKNINLVTCPDCQRDVIVDERLK